MKTKLHIINKERFATVVLTSVASLFATVAILTSHNNNIDKIPVDYYRVSCRYYGNGEFTTYYGDSYTITESNPSTVIDNRECEYLKEYTVCFCNNGTKTKADDSIYCIYPSYIISTNKGGASYENDTEKRN